MNCAGRRFAAFALGLLAVAGPVRADLGPGDLLLLTNAKDPGSAELARHYASARKVPDGRVLALDVPAGEEVTPDVYDRAIAGPVRDYLASPQGQGVRCLVLFYGLPLRVAGRPTTDADAKEAAALRGALATLDGTADELAADFAATAKDAGVAVPPSPGGGVGPDRVYVHAVEQALDTALRQTPDAGRQQAVQSRIRLAQQKSLASAGRTLDAAFPAESALPPASPEAVQAASAQPHDPAARALVRRYVAKAAGVFALQQVLVQQLAWTDNAESIASVDSELALVRLADYPHYRWQPNPLNFRTTVANTPVVMTCRIDGPTPQIVKRLIDDAIAVERDGLDGKAVFDSRGLPTTKDGHPDPYGLFDQVIRDTAAFVGSKTKLETVTDDREAVLSPHAVSGVADYCGWYSLRRYVPSCGFVPGAVAYHVASFELISLHDRFEKGWVANLLKDGVAATLGPVAEPYLQSFPRPDEFFPLLMTGDLTLAEVYWKTTPMTSWMQTLIGDPLYRPYARRPALRPQDLRSDLRAALTKSAATGPAGR